MKATASNYLGELKDHLLAFARSLRGRRAFADVLQVEVAEDIRADAARQQGRVGQLAYTAQQSDLEAARLLREAIADGHITADEVPEIRAALRHVIRSAHSDRRITELCPANAAK